MQASDPFIFSFKDKAHDMDFSQRAEIHQDIQCFEQRLRNMTCKHHPPQSENSRSLRIVVVDYSGRNVTNKRP